MAGKTITITTKAYDRLAKSKRDGESFSEVIERVVKPPIDIRKLMSDLSKLSEQTIDAVEEQVQQRRRSKR